MGDLSDVERDYWDDGDYTVERIRRELAAVYTPEGVDVWMTAEHDQWNGWTVTEMLNHNRGDEVLAAIERLVTGAFG
jgi:hypothetical protein